MFVSVDIVGMRYRDLDEGFVSNIDFSNIILEREPKNPYSKHAVKCMFKGIHFGYVSEAYAEKVSNLLNKKTSYRTSLNHNHYEHVISISIDFDFDDYPQSEHRFRNENDILLNRLAVENFSNLRLDADNFAWSIILKMYGFIYDVNWAYDVIHLEVSERELTNFNFSRYIEDVCDLGYDLINEFDEFYELESFSKVDEQCFVSSFKKTFPEHFSLLNEAISIKDVYQYIIEKHNYYFFLDLIVTIEEEDEEEFWFDLSTEHS